LIIDISPATSTFTLSPLSIIDKNKGTLSATITYTPTGTYTDEAKLTVVGAGFNPPIIVPLKGNGVVQSSNVILDESLLTEESFNKFYKENVIGDETWYFSMVPVCPVIIVKKQSLMPMKIGFCHRA
jgi:hypothetical protein